MAIDVKRGSNDTFYTPLKNARDTSYGVSIDELGSSLPKESGVFDIKGADVVIYPTPANSVTNGLRITTIQNLIDLTAADDETDIFPSHTELRQRHHIIALGMKGYIFAEKGLFNEQANADAKYREELGKMLLSLTRYKGTSVAQLPDLSYYTR